MSVKPSSNEDEYFARQDAELKRKLAEERKSKLATVDRDTARELHHMKCPKCGMQLEEITFAGVHIDKCFSCGGIWLDAGELEAVQKKDSGFMSRLGGIFK